MPCHDKDCKDDETRPMHEVHYFVVGRLPPKHIDLNAPCWLHEEEETYGAGSATIGVRNHTNRASLPNWRSRYWSDI
jgi:hypothetical protein